MIKFTSYQVLSLVIVKAVFFFFNKALYGICYSGLWYNGGSSDCLSDMILLVCKLEPNIWIRHNRDIYKYNLHMLTTYKLKWGIIIASWVYLKTGKI